MYKNNDLINPFKQGDRKAFEILFKQYYAPLCLFAQTIIHDRDEVEEIVQGFFVKLWEKRDSIEINSSLRSYLFSSVKNHCLNYIKHQKIRQNYQTHILQLDSAPIETSDYCMEQELIDKIEAGIAALTPRRREIFLLSRDQGLKYREIADQLGISIKTVETQMGQALKELREKLITYRDILVGFVLFGKHE